MSSKTPILEQSTENLKHSIHWDDYDLRVGFQVRTCVDCAWHLPEDGLLFNLQCAFDNIKAFQHNRTISPSKTAIYFSADTTYELQDKVSTFFQPIGTVIYQPFNKTHSTFMNSRDSKNLYELLSVVLDWEMLSKTDMLFHTGTSYSTIASAVRCIPHTKLFFGSEFKGGNCSIQIPHQMTNLCNF